MRGARKKLAKACEEAARVAADEVKHLVEGLRSKRREQNDTEVTNPGWPRQRAQAAQGGRR